MENTSMDLSDAHGRFQNIMDALMSTADNTFKSWEGAGRETAMSTNDDFQNKYEEVQAAFLNLVGSNDEVIEKMQGLHSNLENIFLR
ncbi:WXG100 family type VII secretion target [Nocardiopsis sp. MG754419]|uniref:WXG100 family type VII secretion target n=1 Tax=Nocardiopsis sp. MG754419 TaxID=2259865 RepID=UPI001BAD7623|nr:hypothetical protein [Nocardiopsis sp. MG754419]